jgi:hypothetical protein
VLRVSSLAAVAAVTALIATEKVKSKHADYHKLLQQLHNGMHYGSATRVNPAQKDCTDISLRCDAVPERHMNSSAHESVVTLLFSCSALQSVDDY